MLAAAVCYGVALADQCWWRFKQRVADLLGMDPNHVQAMVLLGIPSTAIELAECVGEPTFTLTESVDNLTFLQQPTEEEGAVNVVYSKAHVAKVWTLEATALSDARQALVNMQEDEGKDVYESLFWPEFRV